MRIVLAFIGLLALGACAQNPYPPAPFAPPPGPYQTVGTLGGAAAGGFIGSQFGRGSGNVAATIGGALVGAIIGNTAGRAMDQQNNGYQAYQVYQVIPTASAGMPVQYVPMTNILVRNEYVDTQSGLLCREFQSTSIINNKPQLGNHVACRLPNGVWQER